MTQLGFFFNMECCVGCKTCQVACKQRNQLPIGINYRTVYTYETGQYPNARMYHFAATCNHCENPACVRSCPTGAMYKSEDDGTVQHDDGVCIGCQQCVNSCPYGVPRYLPDQNISGKCYACRDTREVDGSPTCVAACGQRAIEFGPLDELQAAHPEAVCDIAALPESSATGPSLLIQTKEAALETAFKELRL